MDKELEEKVVRSFFTKRIQDRVMFELFSAKKREDVLHRLNHNYTKTLREECMIEIPKPNSCADDIAKLLKQHGAGKECYSISWNKKIDGKELPLLTALEDAVG